MKLPDVLSKLKNARPKITDLRFSGMDRAGDWLIACSLAIVLTGAMLAALYGPGHLTDWPLLHHR